MATYGANVGSGSFVNRSKTGVQTQQAQFNSIHQVKATDTHFTASNAGAMGFVVVSASNGMLHPLQGTPVSASDFTAGVQYNIGLTRVSGTGIVNVLKK